MEQIFPNGFDSWQETHYEIVSSFATIFAGDSDIIPLCLSNRQEGQGIGGMYELAKEWTDEFEKLYEGKLWGGEYFDAIDEFLNKKYNDSNN